MTERRKTEHRESRRADEEAPPHAQLSTSPWRRAALECLEMLSSPQKPQQVAVARLVRGREHREAAS